jgi:hypothetical protein
MLKHKGTIVWALHRRAQAGSRHGIGKPVMVSVLGIQLQQCISNRCCVLYLSFYINKKTIKNIKKYKTKKKVKLTFCILE